MSKIAGYLVLVGVSEFLFLMLIAEFLYPGYSVSHNYISDLGVGKTAIIFNTAIIMMGILIIIASILIRNTVKPSFTTYTILLTGLGAMFVGIFPETTGMPHLISALIAFLFGGISSILTSVYERNYFWTALGLITLVSLALFIAKSYEGLGPGGMERLIVYPELIWGISFGTRLLSNR